MVRSCMLPHPKHVVNTAFPPCVTDSFVKTAIETCKSALCDTEHGMGGRNREAENVRSLTAGGQPHTTAAGPKGVDASSARRLRLRKN